MAGVTSCAREPEYEYLLKRGLVGSAEDFIARAATESSMSGTPYMVRCGANASVQSGTWLQAELKRYRANRPAPAPSAVRP